MDRLDERKAELDKKLDNTDLSEAVHTLVKDARRRKVQIIVLIISVSFDLLLTIGIGLGWQANHRLASQAESNRNAIIRSCETSNEARRNNKQLWSYLLSQPPAEPIAPDRQAKIEQFKVFLDKTFAERDCSIVKE